MSLAFGSKSKLAIKENRCDLLKQHYVIDIETGTFELADETMEAATQLYKRVPDAQPWVLRIG